MLPAMTIALGVVGAATLVATGLLLRPSPRAGTPHVSPSATSAPPAGSYADAPVAELADPAWVARVAAAGAIPPRALAAYAGAALALGQTRPGCGIGWNTIAAIGLVETGHGTSNGSRIDPDGVARPSIVGVSPDGQDVDEVLDTDRGELDGDTVLDHPVGPLQLLPAAWAEFAQDGDRDGTTDIHDIDDATLTAGTRLCDIGGDLTQPENWITALSAGNATTDYNNRVADAASQYAMLR
jgi:membrane-bound lytic murein transglycosylase B